MSKRHASLVLLLVFLGLLQPAPGRASDAAFSRALNAAGCAPSQVTAVRNEQRIQVYQVVCIGNPRQTIGVVCQKNACSVSTEGQAENPRDGEK